MMLIAVYMLVFLNIFVVDMIILPEYEKLDQVNHFFAVFVSSLQFRVAVSHDVNLMVFLPILSYI
jgi:hypothetical protein